MTVVAFMEVLTINLTIVVYHLERAQCQHLHHLSQTSQQPTREEPG
jgi:hypothetical protein